MLTLQDAQDVFAAQRSGQIEVIWDRDWLETDDFWVLFHDGREAYETGNPLLGLAGNAPFVVPKDGGAPFRLNTATDPVKQLRQLGQHVVARS